MRFLSFLGIGRQVEHCGFIVHTANDVYIAHILCCFPSSGAICKTIEAACKVFLSTFPNVHLSFVLIPKSLLFLIVTLPKMPRCPRCSKGPRSSSVECSDADRSKFGNNRCHAEICIWIHQSGKES